MSLSALIAREAAVGAVINGVLSAAFAFVLFGGARVVAGAALVADAPVQSFAVAFMATLVPTLLVRQRMRRGGLSGEAATRTAGHAVVRALLVAAAVSLGAWGVQALLFADGAGIDRGAVLIGKTLYGAALGAIVTAVAVKVAICESGIQ
ncbi:MAG TPA: hypothetical protein DEP91_09615 [Sphingomonas bacterium]|uniref:Uncharacterized protein n=1 Tax=Sphingomonas bacterium TaxID=1895847 RepID=A0A3D0WEK4_9SPHN|nr:hypothetical protein [Sphingomonas bacterium]